MKGDPLTLIIFMLAVIVLLGGCAFSKQYSIENGVVKPCGWVAQSPLPGNRSLALQYWTPC